MQETTRTREEPWSGNLIRLPKMLGNSKKAGFTLIELLFVVIVIAVLAAAGVAIYMRSLDKARASEGLAILSSIRTHYLVELVENEVVPPAATFLYDWGIKTDKNKWWIEDVTTGAYTQPGNFDTDWGTFPAPSVITIKGLASGIGGTDILDGIELSIDCDNGTIVQTYP